MRKLSWIAIWLLEACSPQTGADRQSDASPEQAESHASINVAASLGPGGSGGGHTLSEADRAKCVAKGGAINRIGIMQNEACVSRYKDAGKPCSDSDQCNGRCLESRSQGTSTDQPVAGRCEQTNAGFGCFAELKNGKVALAGCVD